MELVLLTRRECHLCEEMEGVLDETLAEMGLSYSRLEIDSDPELVDRFGDTVPVLMRDGKPVAKVRLDRDRLRRIVLRRR